jgi:hypothetical protein
VGLLISGLMCRLSITQTEKRCSAIDGGNGKAPSLFETIGGVTPTLRLVSSFQPGLAGAPQGPGFLYSSRFGGGSLPTPLPAGTHAWGVAMDPNLWCIRCSTPPVQISRCPERRCRFSSIIGGARAVVVGACLTSDKIKYRKQTARNARASPIHFLRHVVVESQQVALR